MRARSRARPQGPSPRTRFDEAYYQRYYLDPRSRIYDQEKHAQLVTGVVSLLEWFGRPLTSVLDVGAGVGWWGAWLREHRPDVTVLSTELEPETCARFGHQQADIARWRLPRTFDLVVCQGVLPYLPDDRARDAIANLAAMTGGVLYLEAITAEDLDGSVDPVLTDTDVFRRSAAWYRRELGPWYREVGAGLWAARSCGLILFALESQG